MQQRIKLRDSPKQILAIQYNVFAIHEQIKVAENVTLLNYEQNK